MATISAAVFREGIEDDEDDGWLYFTFLDTSPRRYLRHWQLRVGPDGNFHAAMYRNDTSTSPYAEGHKAPHRVACALLAAAIRDGLLKTNRQS